MGQTPPKAQVADPFKQKELEHKERALNQRDVELTNERDRTAVAAYEADIAAAQHEIDLIIAQANKNQTDRHHGEKMSVEHRRIDVAEKAKQASEAA